MEYRLLGVPVETTETPMSLRKPRKGEEIHYNFTRGENGGYFLVLVSQVFLHETKIFMCLSVIYVDGSQSSSLRRYLYTMLEGSDPNQGRYAIKLLEPIFGWNYLCPVCKP